jgi:DNA polymerase-3 subunit beta
LPDPSLTLSVREAERDVEISSGASTFHVRLLPSGEFPKLPAPEGDSVTIPAPALIETVDRVALAASRDEARPVLTGILVSAEERALTMVATDSYRLSVKHTELEQPVSSKLEANVPARALRELSRIVTQEESGEVEVFLLANQAVFRCDGVMLSSRLIEGQFPNYQQLLPESYEHEVRLPREELEEVVRRVSLLAQKNAPLRLAFSEGELTVSAETADVGGAEESLPAPFQGETLEIGFNPEFFRAGVEIMDADEVVLKLISPLRPGLLQPAGRDDFSYLVMPIRLNV